MYVVGLVHVAHTVGKNQVRCRANIECIRQVNLELQLFVLQFPRTEVCRGSATH